LIVSILARNTLVFSQSGLDSIWTFPSSSGFLDSLTGLYSFTSWITANSGTLPFDADHYMLVTRWDTPKFFLVFTSLDFADFTKNSKNCLISWPRYWSFWLQLKTQVSL